MVCRAFYEVVFLEVGLREASRPGIIPVAIKKEVLDEPCGIFYDGCGEGNSE